MTAKFRVYIAASADGFIADREGSVAWLDPYGAEDYGYADFLRGIGTVVMGRASFEFARSVADWPYPEQRSIVLTHRPAQAPPGADVTFRAGDVAGLADELTAGPRDVWIMGGGDVIRQFLDAGRVDTLEIYVIPVLLGGGVPLFPPGARHGLTLTGAAALAKGVARLSYVPA